MDIYIFIKIIIVSEWVKLLSPAGLFATPGTVACSKLLHLWDFPGKSTGVGCHLLLQGIFPTQGQIQVSRIVDRRFTIWATREVQYITFNIYLHYICMYLFSIIL